MFIALEQACYRTRNSRHQHDITYARVLDSNALAPFGIMNLVSLAKALSRSSLLFPWRRVKLRSERHALSLFAETLEIRKGSLANELVTFAAGNVEWRNGSSRK